ncbi:thiol reductant ABC exporter subunit CydD [Halomonas cupida]|uniref:ATP-binding cassette, subfamily C, CydD n=1 Tax=Halomonas cupida TaxID=44933 RepID=A0A1M7AUT9_9GAMM|nr:thiol reductant ABC exporter subunit CydD [Halomonas cupida]SHL46500.1 ATP-binding cassette, subfamily C, CydD [Halomonas cupida]
MEAAITDRATSGGSPARRWLSRRTAEQSHWLNLAVLCGGLAGLATVGQLVLLAGLIDVVIRKDGGVAAVWPWLMGILLLLGVRALLSIAQELAAQRGSQRLRQRVRREVLDHLAALGPVRLTQYHTASLAHQWVEQVEALDGYAARFWVQMRLVALVPLVILVLVAWQDWLAAILLALTAPLIPLFMALVGMGAEALNREQFVAVARLSAHFVDRVRGITTLRLFGAGPRATVEVVAAADDYRRRSLRTLRLAFLSSAVLEFFSSVAIAVVAIYIGFGLLGDIPFGPAQDLTLFSGLLILLLAPEFFQPLRTLSLFYHDRASALAASDGLCELLAETPDERRHVPDRLVDDAHLLLSLQGVTLDHSGRGRVLGPIDLVIPRGDVLAISGPSGSGKSSLLQVLAGFVGAGEGRRLVAHDLAFAWMDQRPLLIHGSLADNLALTAPDADDCRMMAALERAGLGALVRALPEGLETSIGEGGRGLSGGQAQRLALARIFLSNAPLVLLDEPTASLDAVTEGILIEGFRELAAEGRTLVIATHHPALMAMGNRQLIMDAGREVTCANQ